MQNNETPRHRFQFTIAHLCGLMVICSIGFMLVIATFGPAPDESMLAGGDQAVIIQLTNAGLNICDQFT